MATNDKSIPSDQQGEIRIDFTRRGPFFHVARTDDATLRSALAHPTLNDRDRSLITAIFDLCGTTDGGVTNLEEIAFRLGEVEKEGRAFSANGVYKRAKRLESLGVLSARSVKRPGGGRGRPATLYQLRLDLETLPASPASTASTIDLPLTQLELFDERALLHELWDQRLRIDDFWCGLLASVLPISDKSRLSVLETSVHVDGCEIPVTLSARHGSRIPTMRSIKTVIAVLSLVEKIIINQQEQSPGDPVGNRFVIDLQHVLKLMQLPNKGGNRRTVVQHIREWEDTVFRFTEIHPVARESLAERFGEDVFGFKHHQLISQLTGVGVLRSKQKIPTHLGFELPIDLVNKIADTGTFNLFTVTPAIMAEEDPLAIALHLYCRKTIGHKSRVINLNLRTLWHRIAKSSMTYAKFKKRFLALVHQRQAQQMAEDPEYKAAYEELERAGHNYPQCSVLGYQITQVSTEKFAICTDADDPYVGLLSKHARLRAQTERDEAAAHDRAYRLGLKKR